MLRGSGQQLVGSVINFICYYAVGVPALIWFTFKWHWGLEVRPSASRPSPRLVKHARSGAPGGRPRQPAPVLSTLR